MPWIQCVRCGARLPQGLRVCPLCLQILPNTMSVLQREPAAPAQSAPFASSSPDIACPAPAVPPPAPSASPPEPDFVQHKPTFWHRFGSVVLLSIPVVGWGVAAVRSVRKQTAPRDRAAMLWIFCLHTALYAALLLSLLRPGMPSQPSRFDGAEQVHANAGFSLFAVCALDPVDAQFAEKTLAANRLSLQQLYRAGLSEQEIAGVVQFLHATDAQCKGLGLTDEEIESARQLIRNWQAS